MDEPALLQARMLFREYAAAPDVFECLQDFELEVGSLPGSYAPPLGRLLLAAGSEEFPDYAAGCGAFRRLDHGACEMKRLYVRPAFRGKGVGKILVAALIAEARLTGYEKMVLDTLPSMQQAHRLYKRFGFRETPSYHAKPIPGALFFELALR
jgi:ribosomal protein S18 acetylase RimI-like enzyme